MGFDPVSIISLVICLYSKCWCDHALAISSVYIFNVDLDIRVLLIGMSGRHLKYQPSKNIFRLWWCIMICKATAAAETWQSQSTVWAQLAATQACWHILTIIFIIIIALFPFDWKYDTYHCFILFLDISISKHNWQLHKQADILKNIIFVIIISLSFFHFKSHNRYFVIQRQEQRWGLRKAKLVRFLTESC